MESRCAACGYSPLDYAGDSDREWLRQVAAVRAALMFEGFATGASIGGIGRRAELEAELSRLADADDLHGCVHLAHDAALASAAVARAGTSPLAGSVLQVSSSDGGVPKLPVASADVAWRGLSDDRQDEALHHGHAWQALCLWSAEVISALQAEGHPIGPGYAGENLTFAGIEWSEMRTGVVLAIGDRLVAEVTAPAVPCNKNAAWFKGGRFDRMSYAKHPGWSRWYASVLRPGVVRPQDPVREVEWDAAGLGTGAVSPSGGRP